MDGSSHMSQVPVATEMDWNLGTSREEDANIHLYYISSTVLFSTSAYNKTSASLLSKGEVHDFEINRIQSVHNKKRMLCVFCTVCESHRYAMIRDWTKVKCHEQENRDFDPLMHSWGLGVAKGFLHSYAVHIGGHVTNSSLEKPTHVTVNQKESGRRATIPVQSTVNRNPTVSPVTNDSDQCQSEVE
ncbi:hypothetical protein YC2023_080575 [Brassica napus]